MSVLSLFLCVAMLAGTTFAWFTDSVASKNNVITTGNLDVELEYKKVEKGVLSPEWETVGGRDDIFDPNAYWEPGRVEVVYLKVSNLGSLALKYQLGVNVVNDNPGTNVDGDTFYLSEHLVFKTVLIEEKDVGTYTRATAVEDGDTLGFKDYNGKTTALEVGGADYVAMIVYMPETVGNVANHKKSDDPLNPAKYAASIEFGINLLATQYSVEQDSYGPDYDENAWVDGFKVTTANDLQAALNNGKTEIMLMADINATEAIVIPEGQTVALNLAGNTLSGDIAKDTGAVLVNNGSLTVVGGKVTNAAANGAAAIDNNGTLTLDGVTVSGSPIANGGYPEYAVQTAGTLTVEKGTVISGDRGAISIDGDGATTINGGVFTANDINYALTGHVIDLSDDVTGNHTLTINGGTFQHLDAQTAGGVVICNRTMNTVYVNGGSFSGGNCYGNDNLSDYGYGGTFSVKGGTFDAKPAAKYIAADYAAVANGDGTYTVLKGEVVAADGAGLANAIANGKTEVALAPGNYEIPLSSELRGKTLSITGTKDVVIDASKVHENHQFVTGATLTFDGVTLNFGKTNQMGFANTASLIYKNCDINGLQFLYGESITFENCNLNSNGAEHCVWTYGAKNVSFVDCDFTYGDRGINCYKHQDVDGGKQTVTFTNCTFTTDNTASIGAVEINSAAFSVGIDVNMNGCTAPANGEMVYVSEYDTTAGSKTNITVDGKDVYVVAVGNKWATDEVNGNTMKAALQHDAEVINIKVLRNIDCYLSGGVGTANTKEVNVTAVDKDVVLNITCSSDSYNGSYCTYRTVNPDAVMNFSNITLEKSKWSSTTWNTYNIEFYTDVTLTNCIVKHPVTVCEKAVITDTVINTSEDTGNTFYSIWVQSGADLTVNGGEIIGNRGIKADGQYISYQGSKPYGDTITDAKVTNVTVSGTKFTLTGSKPAFLVKLEKANVLVSDVNIENVVADAVNPVWIDEDAANDTTNITITVNGVKQNNDSIREQ